MNREAFGRCRARTCIRERTRIRARRLRSMYPMVDNAGATPNRANAQTSLRSLVVGNAGATHRARLRSVDQL